MTLENDTAFVTWEKFSEFTKMFVGHLETHKSEKTRNDKFFEALRTKVNSLQKRNKKIELEKFVKKLKICN